MIILFQTDTYSLSSALSLTVARKIAPCFLLLDNLEIILGSGTVGSGEEEGGGRTRKRTAHQALDRLLSTLLVEIDGLSSSRTLSKFKHVAEQREGGTDLEGNGEGEEDEQEYKPVIVIATTSDIRLIDRCSRRALLLHFNVLMIVFSTRDSLNVLLYSVLPSYPFCYTAPFDSVCGPREKQKLNFYFPQGVMWPPQYNSNLHLSTLH